MHGARSTPTLISGGGAGIHGHSATPPSWHSPPRGARSRTHTAADRLIMVMRGADDSVALHSCTQQLPRRWLARRFSGSANQCVARLEPAAAAGCPRPKGGQRWRGYVVRPARLQRLHTAARKRVRGGAARAKPSASRWWQKKGKPRVRAEVPAPNKYVFLVTYASPFIFHITKALPSTPA